MFQYLRLWALALVAFHLIAPYLEIEHVWGAGGFPAMPPATRLALVLLVAPLIHRRAAERAWALAEHGWLWLRAVLGKGGASATAAVVGMAAFWAGRLGHLRWGDAYIFANAISHPEARLTYSWQSPFDLYLHAKAWALAGTFWGWDVATTYAAISCLAGGAFIVVLAGAVSEMGNDTSQRLAAAALFLTLGSSQLFFGYVESYTILPVGILLFLWLGLRFVGGKGRLWPAATALAITNGLSPSSLPLAAGILYLGWLAWRRRGWTAGRVALEVLGPMLLGAIGVLALMTAGGHGLSYLLSADAPGGGDARWLVPLFRVETRWEHYTMFSWAHLRDLLNEQVLVAPFGLPIALGLLWRARRGRPFAEPALAFLAVAAAAYLLLTWVWNPDYGGRRDWDLFAPASLPLTALAACLLNRYSAGRDRMAASALVAAVSLMHLVPWVWFNSRPWPWQ